MATNEGKVILTAEDRTAQAFASLDRRIQSASSAVAKAGSFMPAGLASGLSIAGITAFVAQSAQVVSQQRAMAESLGLTVEKFSGYNYVARQSELTQEDLAKALFKVNGVLKDGAEAGSKGAQILARYGITSAQIRSGAVGTDEALHRIADRFAAMPNGIDKSALATELLGDKLAKKLIPFLNQGGKGLDEMAAKGEAAGAVISDKVADAVARANDKLSAFNQTLQTEVLVGLSVLFGLVESTDGDQKIEEMSNRLVQLRGELERLQEQSKQTEQGGLLGNLIHSGDAAKIAVLQTQVAALVKELGKAKTAQLDLLAGKAGGKKGGVTHDKDAAAKAAEAALQEELSVGKKIRDFNEKTQASWIDARTKERETIQKTIDKYDDQGAKLRELTADQIVLQQEAAAGNQQAIDALNALNEKYAEVGATELDAADKQSVFADQAARNIQGITADLFSAAEAGENMGKVITDALRRIAAELAAQAALNAIFGAMESSSTPWIHAIGVAGKGLSHHAMGGDMAANEPSWVGEQGPEIFVPRSAGYVIPNHKLGSVGGGSTSVSVVNNIDARGTSAEMLPLLAQVVRESEARTQRVVFEAIRRGTNP